MVVFSVGFGKDTRHDLRYLLAVYNTFHRRQRMYNTDMSAAFSGSYSDALPIAQEALWEAAEKHLIACDSSSLCYASMGL